VTLGDERLPFKASALADPYDGIDRLPAVFVLEHVRSLYNVGAFFRTADAVRRVRIPMLGIKHSLNVATAGGVVAYELLRRRRQAARRGPS